MGFHDQIIHWTDDNKDPIAGVKWGSDNSWHVDASVTVVDLGEVWVEGEALGYTVAVALQWNRTNGNDKDGGFGQLLLTSLEVLKKK